MINYTRAVPAIALLLLIPAICLCMIPSSEAEYLAVEDDLSISPSIADADLMAGESVTFNLDIKNKSAKDLRVYVTKGNSAPHITTEFPQGNDLLLGPGELKSVVVQLKAGQSAAEGTSGLSFDMVLNDPDRGSPVQFTTSALTAVTVHPSSASPSQPQDEYLALDDDISVSPSIVSADIDSGKSLTVYLDVKNKSAKNLRVYIYQGSVESHISMEFPEGHDVYLEPEEIKSVVVVLSVDKYADEGDYSIYFDIVLNDPDRGSPIPAAASNLVTITVHSTTAGTGMFNKFLGIWDNNMPSYLGHSVFPAAMSFLFIIALGHIVCFEIYPRAVKLIRRRGRI